MKLNPLKIILFWVGFMLLITGLLVLPKFFSSWGGDQTPLTYLGYCIIITAYGVFLLSITTVYFYFTWFKKYWYVNVVCLLATLPIVGKSLLVGSTYQYGIKEKTEFVNNNKIDIVEEYYSFTPMRIRSVSYWKNGLKDSVWTTFDEKGNILKKKVYRNDELIEVLDDH